jgi:hypothetical protein
MNLGARSPRAWQIFGLARLQGGCERAERSWIFGYTDTNSAEQDQRPRRRSIDTNSLRCTLQSLDVILTRQRYLCRRAKHTQLYCLPPSGIVSSASEIRFRLLCTVARRKQKLRDTKIAFRVIWLAGQDRLGGLKCSTVVAKISVAIGGAEESVNAPWILSENRFEDSQCCI